jgi:bifunctional non-homologous end joining protein LigD
MPSSSKKRSNKKSEPRFFIQKHRGRNLHYDFRLEMEGVLKSWAIPKGPSLNPADKRLAMLVADHPLEYGPFEGVIPPGNYGAGPVMLWDYGTYTFVAEARTKREKPPEDMAEAFRNGALKFMLHGTKCKGRWGLIHMKGRGNAWLLVKDNDEFADREVNLTETKSKSARTGRSMEEIFAEDADKNPDCAAS